MIMIENKKFCVIYLTCSKTEPNIRSASHRNSTICHSSARPPKDNTDNFSRKTYRRSFESLEDHDHYGLCKSTFDHIQAQQNERAHDANPTGSAPEGMSNARHSFQRRRLAKRQQYIVPPHENITSTVHKMSMEKPCHYKNSSIYSTPVPPSQHQNLVQQIAQSFWATHLLPPIAPRPLLLNLEHQLAQQQVATRSNRLSPLLHRFQQHKKASLYATSSACG
jgi:hypothetical protein